MDTVFGVAGLLAWNPLFAFGLITAAAVLRIRGWKIPAWLTLVAVGGAVGLSRGLPGCVVTPPPGGEPMDPWVVATWIALLTAAAEWRAPRALRPGHDPSATGSGPVTLTARFRPALDLLIEVAFSTGLFLATIWHPGLAGDLAVLILLYGSLVAGVAAIEALRRRAVRRLTLAAAQAGSVAAQRAAWQAGWLALPGTSANVNAQLAMRIRFGAAAGGPARSPVISLGLLIIALMAAVLWISSPSGSSDLATQASWRSRRLPTNLLTDLAMSACDDITARAINLHQSGPAVLDSTPLDLTAEADLYNNNEVHPSAWWHLWCAVAQAEFGLNPTPARRGRFVCAYISPVDGSAQRYGIWVPPNYDPAQPMPLVLHLHGHMMWSEFGGWQIPDELCTPDAIVISPQARGSLDYVGIQANEVWHTLEVVRGDYAIDPDRIYALGHSMGGTGSWYLATQRPDYFAAIAPSSPNLSPWGWSHAGPPDEAECQDLKVQLQRVEASIGYAWSLRHLPFLASHGYLDRVVPVQNSQQMVNAIKGVHAYCGEPIESQDQNYVEIPTGTHSDYIANTDKLRWLLQQRRKPYNLADDYGWLNSPDITYFEMLEKYPAPPRQPLPAYGPIYRAFDEPFVLVIPDECRRFLVEEPQDDRELALQLIAREVVAFEATWQAHNHHAPPVVTATQYLTQPGATGRANAPVVPRHPVLLGGPDVNLATALLMEGDGPLSAYTIPAGFDFHEDHLTAAGVTAHQPAVLLAIVPPGNSSSAAPANGAKPALPFAVVVSASRGIAYFQCLRRFGVLFTSYALRGRIWFDYALADRPAFDDPALYMRCGFYDPAGALDPNRVYGGDTTQRVLETGGLWPVQSALTWAGSPAGTAGPRAARGPEAIATTSASPQAAQPSSPTPARIELWRTLPREVHLDAPVGFGAHRLGQPLHLGGQPDPAFGDVNGEHRVLNGIGVTPSGTVRWTLPPPPPGAVWHLTGQAGPDYVARPPRLFPAPLVGFRVLVNGQEVWSSAPELQQSPGEPQKPLTVIPAHWQRLIQPFDIALPPGSDLDLEAFGLPNRPGFGAAPPWELPPAVWDNPTLELRYPDPTH